MYHRRVGTSTILIVVAGIFGAFTALDWWRHGGGLTPKRRTWLVVSAVFLLISLYLQVGAG